MSLRTERLARPSFATLALLAGLILVGASPTEAQGSLLAMSAAERSRFEARLSLSDDQKPKVSAIVQRSIREREAIFKKHGITVGGGKRPGLFQLVSLNNDMKGIDQWLRGALSKILSPVQMREFEKIFAERREAIRRRLLN